MDRQTLLATVSRIARKWKRVRASVLDRVPSDSVHAHVGGQAHTFWSARVRACARNASTYSEVTSYPESTIRELALKYLNHRRRKAREASEVAVPTLASRQAAALLAALATFPMTLSRMRILALAQVLKDRKVYPPETDVQEVSWVGGVPNPARVVSTRPESVLWESARTPADVLRALAEDAPVRPTVSCRLDGRLELPSGVRPQRFVLPRGPALEYIRECQPELLRHVGPSACNVGASWETSRPAFEQAAAPNAGSGSAGDLRRAIGVGWKSLKLSRIPQPSVAAVRQVKVNPQAFPGVVSSRVGRNRKEVFAACAEVAADSYAEACGSFVPDVSLWSCGGRGKYSMGAVPGTPLKSRLVLMPETPSTLVESAFSQPLTDMFSKVGGDVMIGSKFSSQGYMRLLDRFSGFSHCKAYDWSGFDSRVREDMIVAAFGIMRACFYGNDSELDNVFLRFISHFLVKRVVTPGGWLYTLAKGVPSGSPFTSLVDSLVNWMVLVDLEVCMGGPGAPNRNRRAVYGDDFVQGYSSDPFERGAFVGLAFSRWGFVAKPGSANEGSFSATDTRTSLPFLSYRFPLGLPARPVEDALQLALVPYRARVSLSGQFSRGVYLDHFSPFDQETADYHVAYFTWLSTRIPGSNLAPPEAPLDLVTPFIRKAAAVFTDGVASAPSVAIDEWFRQERPSRWPQRWIPRSAGQSIPRPGWGQGKWLSALSHLRYSDNVGLRSISGVPRQVSPW